jgi:diguanylate cyclase (GGDEF)-like protein
MLIFGAARPSQAKDGIYLNLLDAELRVFACGLGNRMRTIQQIIDGTAGWRAGAVASALLTLLAATNVAHASCMTAPTLELRTLVKLAGRDPAAVLTQTERDEAASGRDLRMGWRQAARAEAYDILSRPADARRTALRMIQANVTSRTPLHIELLARYAMNGFSTEEIEGATPLVEAARRGQVPGSPADACLQIALGEMERMRGAPEQAVVYLTKAYRATSDADMKQQHVVATEKLARVMDWAGDHLQAISLIEEVMEWDLAQGRTVALSTDLYFRGSFNLGRGAYTRALADFERSRALTPAGVDPVGSGYLDLQTCATLIELQTFARAKALCQRAHETFSRHQEIAAGQAQFFLARIAFAQNDPALALRLLDRLLAKGDVLSSFASAPQAYRLRSDVNKRLGQTSAAYRDLEVYVRSVERQRDSEQTRQSAVLRASLDADRAAVRNQQLRQSLYFSGAREREQSKRYLVLQLSAAVGALLLLVILCMGIFHRRKLTRIANTDPLTGLLNRRFVNEHEKMLIAGNAKAGASLALAIIDLDHFKAVNDTYGHGTGDEVLIAFAQLARSVLRTGDIIARWGGEEFIVIFPHTTQDQAAEALERLQVALATRILTSAGPVAIRFSAGLACFIGCLDLQTLVRSADDALYRAKGSGRNRIEIAHEREPLVSAKSSSMGLVMRLAQ